MFKKFIERVSQFSFNSHFWLWFFILLAIALLWFKTPDFFSLSIQEQEAHERYAQIVRNRGWFLWMLISFSGLGIGVWLTIWGRKIQNKQWETQHETQQTQHASHLQERYEKAVNMLGNEDMIVRIAGCRALMSLGKYDKNMKEQCVSLLFAFIRNPYLEDKDIKFNKNLNQNAILNKMFPYNKPLRADIQEAADSFSVIYNKYIHEEIDIGQITLPDYFLKNTEKNTISLIKANLTKMDCKKVYLYRANMHGAIFEEARLQGADLSVANLQETSLEFSFLQGAILEYTNLKNACLFATRLQKANLESASLQGADLRYANLKEVNLKHASLQGADLEDTIFKDADITAVNMQDAGNLREEQVLSAVWGYDKNGHGEPPRLPEELVKDPEVQEWLATPHYDLSEIDDNDS